HELQDLNDSIEDYRDAIRKIENIIYKGAEHLRPQLVVLKAELKELEKKKEQLEAHASELQFMTVYFESMKHSKCSIGILTMYWRILRTTYIVQSSGYGKTRMIAELASEIHTLYICNRTSGSAGYPPASPIAGYIFSLLDRKNDPSIGRASEVEPFAMIMLAAAEEVKACGLSPSEFWRMQICDRTACTNFWQVVWRRYLSYGQVEREALRAKLCDDSFIFNLFGNGSSGGGRS
ncbi:uncharacterized protein VTP21DRAFT_2102, partial [Calcarisporiella thermophila]|uniref:uncharacterized protein n=1 Tax=Calcarisporiella thermophila TaxID=911321 RepID=UPI003744033A